MQHKIAVFDNRLLPEAKKRIQELTTEKIIFPSNRSDSEQELIDKTDGADIILASPFNKISAHYLDACPSVKYVCLCGTSTSNINLDELSRRNVAFTNITGHGDEPAAEFVFMELLELLRGVGKYQWKAAQHELMGKHIGIIGLGALGKSIARLALAYKMNVSYYSLHRKPDMEKLGLIYAELPVILTQNDIVIVSSPSNVVVLGKHEFKILKQDSILVQASGGIVFDRESFQGWIENEGNYAIFDRSAGDENYSTFKDVPRIIFADVIAGDTYETLERLGNKVYENLKNYIDQNDNKT